MSKIVQWRGGTRDEQDAYLGPPREITVDTSNNNLRLHDGNKVGGFEILNRDNADVRYQARNDEFDGLENFEPQQRGFLVRRGPGNYALRRMTVNLQNLTVVNDDGEPGNPLISLAPTIQSSHTFTANQTFLGSLTVTGGLNGNTFGTHTGNVIGSVTGNVTGNLFGNAFGNHTGSFKGDGDFTTDDVLFRANQIPAEVIDGLENLIRSLGVPAGTIVAWFGIPENVPAGWFICDGTNGTPDLSGRFIRGASGLLPPGTVGGSVTHTHTGVANEAGGHSHGVTIAPHTLSVNQIPGHTHRTGMGIKADALAGGAAIHGTFAVAHTWGVDYDAEIVTAEALTSSTGGGESHAHGASMTTEGLHNHTIETNDGSNIPPFMALLYIMKG